jgi:hypothetical protein
MTSRAQDLEHRFVEVGWGFSDVLFGSRALRWMVPGTVLGVVVPSDALFGC